MSSISISGNGLQKRLCKTLFTSELGLELLNLFTKSSTESLNPLNVKDIMTFAEDTRIATKLSEVQEGIMDKNLLIKRISHIENLRLNLQSGQQCGRDFFLCLQENLINWPDVFSFFSLKLKFLTECSICNVYSEYETTQLYIELPVPPNNSNLKKYVEEYLNEETRIDGFCEDQCEIITEKIQKTRVSIENEEAKFLVIILSRGVQTEDGFKFLKSNVNATEEICLR